MVVSILTLFPEIFQPFLTASIIGRAQHKKLLKIRLINIRDFGIGRHKQVDDSPYGGGAGMLLKVDVVYKAIQAAKNPPTGGPPAGGSEKIILLDPVGKLLNQKKAAVLSRYEHLILICGHYEGIDYRITRFVDEKISVGRYILTGGELPALIVADCISRLIPGVLTNPLSNQEESYSDTTSAEAPQYTRPPQFKNLNVPKVLLSGNHQAISNWKSKKSKK